MGGHASEDDEGNSLAIKSNHRAKVSNGGYTPRETVKRTHGLSNRAHWAKVSNGGHAARDGEDNSQAIESTHRQPCIVELAEEGDP